MTWTEQGKGGGACENLSSNWKAVKDPSLCPCLPFFIQGHRDLLLDTGLLPSSQGLGRGTGYFKASQEEGRREDKRDRR